MQVLFLLTFVFFLSIFCTLFYKKIANVHGPFSIPNNRTLHEKPVVNGGGISIIFSSFIGYLVGLNIGLISLNQFFIFGFLALLTGLIGVLDERINIKPKYQFFTQLLSASMTIYGLGLIEHLKILIPINFLLIFFTILILILIVWLYNAFNFVDGSDGMASSCVIFISLPMAFFLYLKGYKDISFILGIILITSVGFLFFNKPKASIFMGDSGTKFLSFILVAVLIDSLIRDHSLLFVWLTLSGFYIVDTTLTTTIRFFTVPRFWEGHRTHAYQNLAQLWNSHKKILKLAMLFNLLWCTPLSFLAYFNPIYSPYICLLSLIPNTIYSYRFGPMFNSKKIN